MIPLSDRSKDTVRASRSLTFPLFLSIILSSVELVGVYQEYTGYWKDFKMHPEYIIYAFNTISIE